LPNQATRITLVEGDANHLTALTVLPVEFSGGAVFWDGYEFSFRGRAGRDANSGISTRSLIG
jgi:hypothetical protein